jgi:hypothetical protein
MSYEKIDDKRFAKTESVSTVFNIDELKDRKTGLQNDIVRIEEEITQIDALLVEAEKIGVKI